MTDNTCAIAQSIQAAIPNSLDSIITRNRQLARLYLATNEEIASLSRIIPPVAEDGLRGEVSDWRLISYQTTLPDKPPRLFVHLIGDNAQREIGTKITSSVVGIDLGSRLVATNSGSIYRLVGEQGSGEPNLQQLLQICGAFWAWGRGSALGVLPVWY